MARSACGGEKPPIRPHGEFPTRIDPGERNAERLLGGDSVRLCHLGRRWFRPAAVEPFLQPVEIEVNHRRRVERQHLAQRQPLGYAMVGGLALSQVLTLYTTPVVYLYLDRLQKWLNRGRTKAIPAEAAEAYRVAAE